MEKTEQLSKLPALQVKDKPFVGIEAEGPFRGERTLFVPGSVTFLDALLAFVQCQFIEFDVEQIYYGAGNDRDVSEDVIWHLQLMCKSHNLRLTVEVEENCPSVECFFPFHVVSLNGDFDENTEYKKEIKDGVITWKNKAGDSWETPIDDPLFAADRNLH